MKPKFSLKIQIGSAIILTLIFHGCVSHPIQTSIFPEFHISPFDLHPIYRNELFFAIPKTLFPKDLFLLGKKSMGQNFEFLKATRIFQYLVIKFPHNEKYAFFLMKSLYFLGEWHYFSKNKAIPYQMAINVQKQYLTKKHSINQDTFPLMAKIHGKLAYLERKQGKSGFRHFLEFKKNMQKLWPESLFETTSEEWLAIAKTEDAYIDICLMYAELYHSLPKSFGQNIEKSKMIVKNILKIQSQNPEVYHVYGNIHFHEKKYIHAIKAYKKSNIITQKKNENPKYNLLYQINLLKLAESHFKLNQKIQGKKSLLHHLEKMPKSTQGIKLLQENVENKIQ